MCHRPFRFRAKKGPFIRRAVAGKPVRQCLPDDEATPILANIPKAFRRVSGFVAHNNRMVAKLIFLLELLVLSLTANAYTLGNAGKATGSRTALRASQGISMFDFPLSGSTPASGFNLETYLDKAAREDALFKTDPSVFFWRYLESQGESRDRHLISDFFTSVMLTANPTQRAVWTTFLVRTGYFAANAAAANLFAGQRGASIMVGDMDFSFPLYELIKCYEQELNYIEEGRIKYPWDYMPSWSDFPSSTASLVDLCLSS
jgi:hypothetical protein